MSNKHLQILALATAASILAACQTTAPPPSQFDRADADHNKSLSLDEANGYLVTEIFSSRDANKDGKLTREEWAVSGDASQEKALRDRDANKDGVVTIDEALAYGRKRGMAKKFMTGADKNKDGQLSPEEVQSYYGSREGPPR